MRTPWRTAAVFLAAAALAGVGGYLLGLWQGAGTLVQYRAQLEVIYFITAGPLLLLVVLAGLSQILLSAREIAAKSKRDAAALAMATCDKFAKEYFTVEPRAVKALESIKLRLAEWKLLDDLLEWRSFADENAAREWARKLAAHAAESSPATETVNLLEAIAMAFVHGKADQDIGYLTLGAAYCQAVRRWAPHLVALRTQQTGAASGPFAATQTLYRTWEARRRERGE